jgi:hypothetical protein
MVKKNIAVAKNGIVVVNDKYSDFKDFYLQFIGYSEDYDRIMLWTLIGTIKNPTPQEIESAEKVGKCILERELVFGFPKLEDAEAYIKSHVMPRVANMALN